MPSNPESEEYHQKRIRSFDLHSLTLHSLPPTQFDIDKRPLVLLATCRGLVADVVDWPSLISTMNTLVLFGTILLCLVLSLWLSALPETIVGVLGLSRWLVWVGGLGLVAWLIGE